MTPEDERLSEKKKKQGREFKSQSSDFFPSFHLMQKTYNVSVESIIIRYYI